MIHPLEKIHRPSITETTLVDFVATQQQVGPDLAPALIFTGPLRSSWLGVQLAKLTCLVDLGEPNSQNPPQGGSRSSESYYEGEL